MRRTVPPSAEVQASIDELLSQGMVDDPQRMLSELVRLGARLLIQRAVDEEFDTWLGRARYERRAAGEGNGRPGHVQTAEGELRIEIPQVREAAMPFVSKLFPKWHRKRLLRTDPLKALIIGGFVRGLSMRDVESLCEQAGLGRTSKSTVSRVCRSCTSASRRSSAARARALPHPANALLARQAVAGRQRSVSINPPVSRSLVRKYRFAQPRAVDHGLRYLLVRRYSAGVHRGGAHARARASARAGARRRARGRWRGDRRAGCGRWRPLVGSRSDLRPRGRCERR